MTASMILKDPYAASREGMRESNLIIIHLKEIYGQDNCNNINLKLVTVKHSIHCQALKRLRISHQESKSIHGEWRFPSSSCWVVVWIWVGGGGCSNTYYKVVNCTYFVKDYHKT